MAEKPKKTITIKHVNWKKLSQIKLDEDMSNLDDVLEHVFKKAKI